MIDRREAIDSKIRRNLLLTPAEVALYAGVEPKTVTGQWIRREGLPASKIGSRTLRIEPNALRCWLIDKRVKPSGSRGGSRRGLLPVSKKISSQGASPTAETNIPETSNLSRRNNA